MKRSTKVAAPLLAVAAAGLLLGATSVAGQAPQPMRYASSEFQPERQSVAIRRAGFGTDLLPLVAVGVAGGLILFFGAGE